MDIKIKLQSMFLYIYVKNHVKTIGELIDLKKAFYTIYHDILFKTIR